MSKGDNELFVGEDVGVDVFDVDMQGSDAIGRRGDLVRDVSDVHEEVRNVLGYGWDFEVSSGSNWWDFGARYEGDKGCVSVRGRPDGRIGLHYRTNAVVQMPENVEEQVEYLNSSLGSFVDDIGELEKESAGITMILDEDLDLDDESSRYIRDAVGLYAGVDGDCTLPSFGDPEYFE